MLLVGVTELLELSMPLAGRTGPAGMGEPVPYVDVLAGVILLF
jgi:hypothetical protein